jgi:hypothetical protein
VAVPVAAGAALVAAWVLAAPVVGDGPGVLVGTGVTMLTGMINFDPAKMAFWFSSLFCHLFHRAVELAR